MGSLRPGSLRWWFVEARERLGEALLLADVALDFLVFVALLRAGHALFAWLTLGIIIAQLTLAYALLVKYMRDTRGRARSLFGCANSEVHLFGARLSWQSRPEERGWPVLSSLALLGPVGVGLLDLLIFAHNLIGGFGPEFGDLQLYELAYRKGRVVVEALCGALPQACVLCVMLGLGVGTQAQAHAHGADWPLPLWALLAGSLALSLEQLAQAYVHVHWSSARMLCSRSEYVSKLLLGGGGGLPLYELSLDLLDEVRVALPPRGEELLQLCALLEERPRVKRVYLGSDLIALDRPSALALQGRHSEVMVALLWAGLTDEQQAALDGAPYEPAVRGLHDLVLGSASLADRLEAAAQQSSGAAAAPRAAGAAGEMLRLSLSQLPLAAMPALARRWRSRLGAKAAASAADTAPALSIPEWIEVGGKALPVRALASGGPAVTLPALGAAEANLAVLAAELARDNGGLFELTIGEDVLPLAELRRGGAELALSCALSEGSRVFAAQLLARPLRPLKALRLRAEPPERNAVAELSVPQLLRSRKVDLPEVFATAGQVHLATWLLRTNERLSVLGLGGNQISDAAALVLARLLGSTDSLTVLSLFRNLIGNQGGTAIADALRSNQSLTVLGLGENKLGDAAASALAAALASNRSLRVLSLVGNKIADEGAMAIAGAIAVNDSVQQINLLRNRFGQEAAERLLAACLAKKARPGAQAAASPAPASAPASAPPTAGAKAGAKGGALVVPSAAALPGAAARREKGAGEEPPRRRLKLLRAARASAAEQAAEALQIVSLTGIHPEMSHARLVLRSQADPHLAGYDLLANHSLQRLDLGANLLGDGGALALAQALTRDGAALSLARLTLHANSIGDVGAIELARALRSHCPRLTKLELGGNRIGSDGAVALASSLGSNPSLLHLYLQANQIGDEGGVALGNCLKANRTLVGLYLSQNELGDVAAVAIANGLLANLLDGGGLAELWLDGNRRLTKKGRQAVSSGWAGRPRDKLRL